MKNKQAPQNAHESFTENIEKEGRQLIGIVGIEDEHQPFIYTIGNKLKGLPELLLIGSCNETAASIVDLLSELMIRQGRAFKHGELIMVGGDHPVRVCATDHRAREFFTTQATDYYATDEYVVQQIIIPDVKGRFPEHPGCKYKVPILNGMAN